MMKLRWRDRSEQEAATEHPNVEFRRAPLAVANIAGVYRVAWNVWLGRGLCTCFR